MCSFFDKSIHCFFFTFKLLYLRVLSFSSFFWLIVYQHLEGFGIGFFWIFIHQEAYVSTLHSEEIIRSCGCIYFVNRVLWSFGETQLYISIFSLHHLSAVHYERLHMPQSSQLLCLKEWIQIQRE